ncbi:MAG: adenylate kinase [Candidatus Pacearchaeota archaeon]|nr:adenylate kinase [Candidatus Pacearchaeota archaeon]
MKIILLGSPGVGKGTYASFIKEKYKLPHISTGDLFREAMKNGTPLGKKAKEYIDRGDLVPDDLTVQILKERISKPDCENGFMLDGFPRTIPQAEALDKITKIELAINFFASEKIILQRLGGRRICKKCGAIFHLVNKKPKKEGVCDICGGELYQRSDEMPEIIKERLKTYHEKTKPLEDYYKKKGILRGIMVDADINAPNFKEAILDKIDEAIESVKK